MTQLGRWIVIAGVALVCIGLVIWLLGRLGFRGLPGDIRYESENVKFYFPIVTSIVLSILLTGALWLIAFLKNWWNR
jgi:ABC-type anion transport system duplicated permease subunit